MAFAEWKTVCAIHFLDLMPGRDVFRFFVVLRGRRMGMQIIRATITVIFPLIDAINGGCFGSAIDANDRALLELKFISENKAYLIFSGILAMVLNEHIIMIGVIRIIWLN